jgi:peptide/nickel transport system substrate-binding protein
MKKIAIAAVAIATALALSACSSGGSSKTASDPSTPSALKIGNFLPVSSWDPAQGGVGFDGPYLSAIYDPLVYVSPSGAPEPALATSWTWSQNDTVLSMKLRGGVTFTDGSAFNADAAVANIEHLAKGTMTSTAYTDMSSVSAAGSNQITITLKQPDSAFLYELGLGNSYMASPKALNSPSLATTPVGSGPYTFDASKSTAGSVYYFTKKASYWDSKQYPFKTVEIQAINDQTARNNAMLSGQLNLEYASAGDINQAKQHDFNIAQAVGTWVGINFVDRQGKVSAPLGNVKVRQAINYAFDSAGILKTLAYGAGVATNQVFTSTSGASLPSLAGEYSYNVKKAKQLLAQAGYANGFSVTMPMSPAFQPYQAIATQSLKAIGIDVTWDNMSQIDYQQRLNDYPMFLCVLALDSNAYATVQNQLAGPTWTNPLNSAASDPTLSSMMNKLPTAGNQQAAQIKAINQYVTNNAWFAVWMQADNVYFSAPGIKVTPIVGLMFPTLRYIQPGK